MKTLYLDCGMGAAGDMLMAALYELLDENQQKEFLSRINENGPENVYVSVETVVKCGITGTHMKVSVEGAEEDEHLCGGHFHHHHHSGMEQIEEVLDQMPFSRKVRSDAAAVYRLIAEAESRVHAVPVSEIHFHEVGDKDAITDITAVCLLIEMLQPEKIIASPICTGSGQVRCAHGILPVPAPATAELLKNVPAYGGAIQGELCTPTGAALLKYFVGSFSGMPVMKIEKIGYGMGKKEFERANCVRAMLGETEREKEEVFELCCNLDDITAEQLGFAMEILMEAGALDVYTVPIGMKKSRPGQLLCVICLEKDREKILRLIFLHTTTLGVREHISRRYTLSRRTERRETAYGSVRLKRSEGFGVVREKYEYDDLARIAREKGLSIAELTEIIDRQCGEEKGTDCGEK